MDKKWISCNICGYVYHQGQFHTCSNATDDNLKNIIPEGIPGVWMPEANYRKMEARIRELEKENEQLRIENRELWAAVDSYIEDDQDDMDETAQGGANHGTQNNS